MYYNLSDMIKEPQIAEKRASAHSVDARFLLVMESLSDHVPEPPEYGGAVRGVGPGLGKAHPLRVELHELKLLCIKI